MKLINLECFPVTEDEAVEMTIHHLRLAAIFFMNTPEDLGHALKEEARRLAIRRNQQGGLPYDYADLADNGIAAFIEAMPAAAEVQKDND